MSDIFDHECDAFDSMSWDDDYCYMSHQRLSDKTFRKLDRAAKPSYTEEEILENYFTKYVFDLIEHETPKAFLFLMEFEGSQYPVSIWVPKSICRGLSRSKSTVYLHTGTFARVFAEFKEKNNG